MLSLCLALGMVSLPLTLLRADVQAPAEKMTDDSVIEPQALNFARGAFGTCINGQTFQIDAVTSFKGWQYATYYDAGTRLCVARRRLPKGPWQRIAFDDATIRHTDVHNVPVMGLCPIDGTIHLSFDHHNSPLHYRVSRAGAATNPEAVEWTAALFGATTSELVKGQRLAGVTYPEFFIAPDGRLQLYYRIGGSGRGDSHLAEYDPAKGGWSVLGEFIHRGGRFADSSSRNAYHNGFDYGPDGRLHTTWTWREGQDNSKWGLLNCHDLMYAWSDDGGRTWRNNDGQAIGVTGKEAMHVASPGITVRELPYRRGIMNQVTQTVDGRGRLHVVMWHHPPEAPEGSNDMNAWRYFHHWRDEQGKWHSMQLPCFGRKPSVVADRNDDLILVFTKPKDAQYHGSDPGGPLLIFKAAAAQNWDHWKELHRTETSFVGEPRLDRHRWREEQVLSVYAQEAPSQAGKPSALHLMDFKP